MNTAREKKLAIVSRVRRDSNHPEVKKRATAQYDQNIARLKLEQQKDDARIAAEHKAQKEIAEYEKQIVFALWSEL